MESATALQILQSKAIMTFSLWASASLTVAFDRTWLCGMQHGMGAWLRGVNHNQLAMSPASSDICHALPKADLWPDPLGSTLDEYLPCSMQVSV